MELTIIFTFCATIFLSIVFGCLNSLLSYFLDYCFWEGSIFSGWLPFLAKTNLYVFNPAKLNALSSAKKNTEYDNMLIQEAQNMFFFKILGGCIVCSNIWLGLITFIVLWLNISVYGFSFYLIFPYLLFSSFFLRKIIAN